MSVVIFVGPTLRADDVTACIDARVLPPVQQGDVYRVARDKPQAIGIVDGFFDGVPSVWHKEILWAMEQGIPVFGSASMGALRAAELAEFGMIGVGRIYEDFAAGVLHDDDEVAVVHGPSELGYLPLSVPMVSIRATVDRARSDGVVDLETAQDILRIAKAMHYRQRGWDAILEAVQDSPAVQSFANWLPEGEIDAKAEDARAMLTNMAAYLDHPPCPSQPPERTERTLAWKDLTHRIDTEAPENHAVINELRLRPDLYAQMRERAALSLLARDDAARLNHIPDRDTLADLMAEHRHMAGLPRRSDLIEWLNRNDMSPAQYEGMLSDKAHTEASLDARNGHLEQALLTELRRANLYTELRDRAASKANNDAAPKTGMDRLRLLMWYFETVLDRDMPDDLESYAIKLGLAGQHALHDLIEAEFTYRGT